MPATPSAVGLHLRYRLWIAELNFDINVLRIFGDYLTDVRAKRKESDVKSKSDYFEKEFQKLRNENDELRHEMQLSKMKLGAIGRDGKDFDYTSFNKESQLPTKKRHAQYKAVFKKINKEFEEFESQCLS